MYLHSSNSDERASFSSPKLLITPHGIQIEDRSKMIMHARRQQDSKDDSLSKGSRSNLQQYNNFDSFRERSNDVMASSGLDIPLPVLNPAFRYSLDSRAQFPGSQRGDSNLP